MILSFLKPMHPHLYVVLLAMVLDVVTTVYALRFTTLKEANFLLKPLMDRIGVWPTLLVTHLPAMWVVYSDSQNFTPSQIWALVVIWTAVAIWNLFQIARWWMQKKSN